MISAYVIISGADERKKKGFLVELVQLCSENR